MPRPHEFQTPNRRGERLPLEGKSFLCPVCLCVDFYRSNIPGWRARHASPLRSITNCLPPLIRPLCGHLPPGEGIPQKDGTLLLRPTVHPLRATQAWPTSPYTPGGFPQEPLLRTSNGRTLPLSRLTACHLPLRGRQGLACFCVRKSSGRGMPPPLHAKSSVPTAPHPSRLTPSHLGMV